VKKFQEKDGEKDREKKSKNRDFSVQTYGLNPTKENLENATDH
jgi:hypothetical protein